MQAILSWFAGEAEAPEDLPVRVRDFPSAVGGELLVREATLAVVNTLAPAPKRDEARALLKREYEEWRERDEPRSSRALWGLAWVEFWAGRWALGAEYAARARDISIQYGLEMPQDQLPSAVIAAHRGQLDLAREHSERGFDLAHEQFRGRPVQLMAVLGLVARWSGDPSAAENWFEKADRRASELGWGEPSVRWWTADYAECFSRTVGSMMPFESSMSGRRMPRGWPVSGCWHTRPDAVVSSPPQKGTSPAPVPFSSGQLRSTRRSETRSALHGHCSGSASSGGGHGRSGTPATRSRPHSTDSEELGQRPGSRRLAASWDESAVASARRG